MKKILSVVIIIIFICTLVGCNTEPGTTDYLVLVNKTHKIPDDWEQNVELVTVENSLGEKHIIEHRAFEAFSALREELVANEGIQIELDSVYRSTKEQQELWDEWSTDPELGEEYCQKYLAAPGYSEHQTGLAVDIFIIKDGKEIRDNDDMIADKADFAKVHKYLAEHGFILRYPKGKEDITGYDYEPWHLRYIDSPLIAQEITDYNFALEEYVGVY